MQGIWKGTYSYLDKRIPEAKRNEAVSFTIQIDVFDGKNFSGLVEDDLESGGMKGQGQINGSLRGNKIAFVKQMPMQSFILPDGSRIEQNKPHRKIYYSGILSNDRVEGQWKFKFGFGRLNKKLVFYPASKGLWQMEKQDK